MKVVVIEKKQYWLELRRSQAQLATSFSADRVWSRHPARRLTLFGRRIGMLAIFFFLKQIIQSLD